MKQIGVPTTYCLLNWKPNCALFSNYIYGSIAASSIGSFEATLLLGNIERYVLPLNISMCNVWIMLSSHYAVLSLILLLYVPLGCAAGVVLKGWSFGAACGCARRSKRHSVVRISASSTSYNGTHFPYIIIKCPYSILHCPLCVFIFFFLLCIWAFYILETFTGVEPAILLIVRRLLIHLKHIPIVHQAE